MSREVKCIWLYGDGDLTACKHGWAIYIEDEVVVCDFSEVGAYMASRLSGDKVEVVKISDVLAENLFAAVKAPGCDRVGRLVAKAGAKTAIELLAYLTRKHA